MVVIKKSCSLALSAVLLAAVLQGCSGEGSLQQDGADKAKNSPAITSEPVHLTMYGSMSDELFQKLVAEPVKMKYPNITMSQIKNEKKIEELITAGEVPDMINDTIASIIKYEELGLTEDLHPYVKQFNMDLNRIDPIVLDTVRKTSGDGKLLGIPISGNVVMMYYNKDIFDRFAVPYPKDGMTWDEVYDLARQLTRSDGAVKYRGFDFQDSFQFAANQLSLSVVDARTNKAFVNNDGWKKLYENYARFFHIPGNEVDAATYGKGLNQFLKDRSLAMYVTSSIFSRLPDAVKEGLNFDVVTLPSFAEAPNTTTQVDGGVRMITSTSKHKNEAFAALSAMLSEDAQKQIASLGNTSVLKDSKINEEFFGRSQEILQTRNRLGFVKNKPAKPPEFITKYDAAAYGIVRSQFKKWVTTGQSDINSILREAEELVNKSIADARK
ncbi:ABC transporter substrate-binding protein [Paenibacillus silviterrae]|uniref:ABC transporter substrate-binding protein n=1 Tax=Paenibacillus silviterrae TaxID=3242194 RepID=UPI002543222E|nr:extracellular solute-binding protein [Paenibacillus chinjuensis]